MKESNNKLIIEKLTDSNRKLIIENSNLTEQMKNMKEDNSFSLNSSRSVIDSQFEIKLLKEKIFELEKENQEISSEKDKLLVELSKLMS